MTKAETLAELDRTFAATIEELRTLPAECLTYSPGGEEWTIAEIVRHIGNGVIFQIDLYENAGGTFAAEKFPAYSDIVRTSRDMPLDDLLSSIDADFQRYRASLESIPDDAWETAYSVTMPSGRVRTTTPAEGATGSIGHTAEHRQQIRDWLARRDV